MPVRKTLKKKRGGANNNANILNKIKNLKKDLVDVLQNDAKKFREIIGTKELDTKSVNDINKTNIMQKYYYMLMTIVDKDFDEITDKILSFSEKKFTNEDYIELLKALDFYKNNTVKMNTLEDRNKFMLYYDNIIGKFVRIKESFSRLTNYENNDKFNKIVENLENFLSKWNAAANAKECYNEYSVCRHKHRFSIRKPCIKNLTACKLDLNEEKKIQCAKQYRKTKKITDDCVRQLKKDNIKNPTHIINKSNTIPNKNNADAVSIISNVGDNGDPGNDYIYLGEKNLNGESIVNNLPENNFNDPNILPSPPKEFLNNNNKNNPSKVKKGPSVAPKTIRPIPTAYQRQLPGNMLNESTIGGSRKKKRTLKKGGRPKRKQTKTRKARK